MITFAWDKQTVEIHWELIIYHLEIRKVLIRDKAVFGRSGFFKGWIFAFFLNINYLLTL